MKKILLFTTILLILCQNIYAAALTFSPAPSIYSYLSDDFQQNILPILSPVSDIYFQKAVKKYKQITFNDTFILYENKVNSNNSIEISKDYLLPTSSLSLMCFLVEKQAEFSFVELFFIESTGKISQVYSVSGYVKNNTYIENSDKFSFSPAWIYGTLALIYDDASDYTSYDILSDNESLRAASLIFIPEDKTYIENYEDYATYPALNVINKKNSFNMLVKDRRLLAYFNKYEAEPQGTFQKYLGGAVTMKVYLYAYTFSKGNINGKEKIDIISAPALFQLEKDKGYNRSFAYQKSYYKSIKMNDNEENILVLDSPNGNEITTIDKTYYRSRDILYIPWENRYAGEELWYAVILPKLNKKGYVLSEKVKIIEMEKR